MINSEISGDNRNMAFQLYGSFKALFKQMLSAQLIVLCLISPVFAGGEVHLLVLGDSLSSGYGLPAGDSFPDQLQDALQRDGISVRIENAGVAGDTSTGGAARLDWALANNPQGVIVELGANDALRAIDPAITRHSLTKILADLQRRNIPVLLAGMKAPPNLGHVYVKNFESIYPDLAEKFQAIHYPFFLEGVAAQPHLNQADGIHPNRRGVEVVVGQILPYVKELIQKTAHNP